MAKTWVLDTETKGTGAHVVPLDKVGREWPERPRKRAPREAAAEAPRPRRERRPARAVERSSTALPPGHVRSTTSGEIGKVRAVDPRAGTATVHWLKRGASSTVPLASISRR